MAASPTKKESIAKAKAAVAATARMLGEWTEQQVQKISVNDNTPYIWPLGQAGYAIGNRKIMCQQGAWNLYNTYDEREHVFDQKLSAVFYCLCEQKGYLRLARNIKNLDSEVNRLKNDIMHYEKSANRAMQNHQGDRVAIWDARLFDAKLRLRNSSEQLRKSLNSAKYIKYWE